MSQKITFITRSRDDLFSMSKMLALAFERDFLCDRQAPVVVCVTGSYNSGKKIMADGARAALLGGAWRSSFCGRKGYDEYWVRKFGGTPLEIDYIDLGYQRENLYHKDLRFVEGCGVETAFMALRKHGGVTYLQNRRPFEGQTKASLDVWIESPYETINQGLPRRGEASAAFQEAAADPTRSGDIRFFWLRYVEIEAHDPRLLGSRLFQSALEKLSAGTCEVAEKIERAGIFKRLCNRLKAKRPQSRLISP